MSREKVTFKIPTKYKNSSNFAILDKSFFGIWVRLGFQKQNCRQNTRDKKLDNKQKIKMLLSNYFLEMQRPTESWK